MNKTYFISDLHLSVDRPDITHCLEVFLTKQARDADALYVLGDLFDAWIGDDDINQFTNQVAGLFKGLATHQTPIYFIHGNRDFLIRKQFAERAGMIILPEQSVVDLYGTPTLIMHGDELCTLDVKYQKFRRKARGWWWPNLMLLAPLWYRRKVANKARIKSKQSQLHLASEITDVTDDEVIKVMKAHNVKRLVHGHTHRPNIHSVQLEESMGQRIVLGDWYDQGSILLVTRDKIDLQTSELNPKKERHCGT